jgi:hypothetical protein
VALSVVQWKSRRAVVNVCVAAEPAIVRGCRCFPVMFFPWCFLVVGANLPYLVTKILRESKRLEKAEEVAEESLRERRVRLLQAQKDLEESLARLDRLRRTKRSLVTRGAEMVSRGLESLDELEELERQESGVVVGSQVNGVFDWDAVGLNFENFPTNLGGELVGPGSGGDIPPVVVDSSQDV